MLFSPSIKRDAIITQSRSMVSLLIKMAPHMRFTSLGFYKGSGEGFKKPQASRWCFFHCFCPLNTGVFVLFCFRFLFFAFSSPKAYCHRSVGQINEQLSNHGDRAVNQQPLSLSTGHCVCIPGSLVWGGNKARALVTVVQTSRQEVGLFPGKWREWQ